MTYDKNLIRHRVEELMNLDLTSLKTNHNGEYYNIVYETDWVRVLLIRSNENPRFLTIDIEITLPNQCIYNELNQDEIAKSEYQNLMKETLIALKKHIDYIVELQENGFTIEMFGREFLYSASKEVECNDNPEKVISSIPIISVK